MAINKGSGRRQASYLLVGAFNTGFALVLFSISVKYFHDSINVLVLLAIVSGFSYLSGYFLYKCFVWNKTRVSVAEFYKFVRSNLFFFGINFISLYVFLNVLDFAPIIVQIITTSSLVAASFFVHDNWTFS